MPEALRRNASRSAGIVVTRSCATPCAAQRAARSVPVGVPKTRSNCAARDGSPCSSVEKIAPPSSLTTTIVSSGTGSWGPISRPLASCRKVRSPISATVGPSPASARPVAVETHPSMPASPREATTVTGVANPADAQSRSRADWDEPTNSVAAPGSSASVSRTADATASPDGSSAAHSGVAASRRPASRQRALHSASSAERGRISVADNASHAWTRPTRAEGSGQSGTGVTHSTRSTRRIRAATSRVSVRRPTTRTRAGRWDSSHGRQVSRSGPCGSTDVRSMRPKGSATTGHPAAAASRTASSAIAGSGRSPSTTTVRGTSSTPAPWGIPGAVRDARDATAVHGSPPGRPSKDSGQS